MPKWTEEQQQVIDLRNKSMLVAAAAGSGKTAVLVERIIQMIVDDTNPVNIDSLLVVTFTNAAAAEMKERIGAAIQEQLLANPMSAHLYQQSLLLQKAQITTLHSFCLDLVRQNFFRLGLDPAMKIADETENQLLLGETIDEVLEMHYSDTDTADDFVKFVDQYGGREDEQLHTMLLELYQMAQSMARPEQWLMDVGEGADVDWLFEAQKDVKRQLMAAKQQLIRAVNHASGDEGLKGYMMHIEQEYNWVCEMLDAFAVAAGEGEDLKRKWNRCDFMLHNGGFQRLPSVKKNTCDELIKEQVTTYRNSAKTIIEKLRKDYFGTSIELQLEEIERQAPVRRWLCDLTLEIMAAFAQKKSDKHLMDFHDMEHFCYQLLYDIEEDGSVVYSELAQLLKTQYTEILVDEYQDINDLQEAILQAVSRENNLFMVGDIKQSIYGFRMANPNLFAEKYSRFSALSDESDCVRIDLNRNFRCRTNVIDGVNEVFSQIMTGQNGDLVYDNHAALQYGANYPAVVEGNTPIPEQINLMVLTASQKNNAEDDDSANSGEGLEQPLSAMEAEGALLCQEIQKLMTEPAQVFDKRLNQYRNITWRDIVVLLRAPKAAGSVYARMMKHAGIPAAVDAGDGYFSAWEIQIMVSLLHIIDNPLQDIPLLAILKAPFFRFTEEELSQMRLLRRKDYYYQCVVLAAQGGVTDEDGNVIVEVDPVLKEKAAVFIDTLRHWRRQAQQLALSQLIWQLYKETGFYEYVGALRDGVQRQANLRALHERARAYEQTSFKGVFAFLRFLEQLERSHTDLEPAKVLGDNDNVVRIMSIHKSKGLEFPVVFIGGLGRKFNARDVQQDFLLDKSYGMAFSVVDDALEIRYKTIAQRVIAQKKRIELLQEEKRVLYVAMTRARERLYLIGSASDPEKRKEVGAEQASCYLDWLIPLALKAPLWNVQYLQSNDISSEEEEVSASVLSLRAMLQNSIPLPEIGEWYNQIDAQLSWQYPDTQFTHVKAQSSVTELKQMFRTNQLAASKDAELQFSFDSRPEAVVAKTGLSSAEKGTLLHLIMSHVDLDREITEVSLQQLVERLEAEQYIAAGSGKEIKLDGVLAFYQSSLGQRLIAANRENRYRELPFIVALDSAAIDSSLPRGQKNILVQGIIDCLWQEEDGGWVLVDYKSDRISKGQIHLILERYSGQMQLYRYAVEQILGEPVKEAYFYLVSSGIVVEAERRG